jgi:ectoine hydroxylase-related dioxygenase (phytanoyl-CoA dioxygenase family)
MLDISDELIRQYERDGAVCIRDAVESDLVTSVLADIDALIADENDRWTTIRSGGFSDRHLWPTMPWMYEFCANSRLPEIVGRLLQSSEMRLFFDHIFVRDPGTRQDTPWHQDRPYWPFTGKQIASVWVALTACDENSGVVQFVRGSHAWGKTFRPMSFIKEGGVSEFLEDNALLEEIPDIDAAPDEYEILRWDMQPGDAIVFNAEIVHGARENTDTSRRRAALSIRYIGDDARWDPKAGTDPIVTQERVGLPAGGPPDNDQWFPLVWSDR